VCAVFPVHGSAGLLSALAFPFVDTTSAFTVSQLVPQIAGVVVLGVWAAGVTLLVYGALKAIGWARVSRDEEIEGLDAAEHGIETYPSSERMLSTTSPRPDARRRARPRPTAAR